MHTFYCIAYTDPNNDVLKVHRETDWDAAHTYVRYLILEGFIIINQYLERDGVRV